MGIGWSAHKNGDWLGQLERVRRWHRRFGAVRAAAGDTVGLDDLDLVYAFFQNSWHLRDWIEKTSGVAKAELDCFVSANQALRLCRDLANGTKHFSISSPSVDAHPSILREYLPPPIGGGQAGHRWLVIAGERRDLFGLADECMSLWERFAGAHPALLGRTREIE